MANHLQYVVENSTPISRKVNVLLQAYISHVKLEKFALACDMVYITQVGGFEERSARSPRGAFCARSSKSRCCAAGRRWRSAAWSCARWCRTSSGPRNRRCTR